MAKLMSLLFLEATVLVVAQWATMTSYPTTFFMGGAVAFGNTVFAAKGTTAHTLDTTTGVWVAVSPRPITASYAGYGALSGQLAIVSGAYPATDAVHIFNLQTGSWTTKASLPVGVSESAAGCDGQYLWQAGGWAPGGRADLQVYDSAADVWTARMPIPTAGEYYSGAFFDGAFVICKGTTTFVYTVTLDAWTSGASLPSNHANLYGGVAAIASFVYVVGSPTTASSSEKLERYDIANDVWTSLDPIPQPSYACACAMTSLGLLVSIGHEPTGSYVHGYTTGFPVSVPAGGSSDPHMRGFRGQRFLFTGSPNVYNIFSSETIQVNAMLDSVPGLPSGWDVVFSHIGIRVRTMGKEIRIMIDTEGRVHSHGEVVGSVSVDNVAHFKLGDVLVTAGVGMRLTTAHFSVQVFPQRLEYGCTTPAKYLDVLINPTWSLHIRVHGILGQTWDPARPWPKTVSEIKDIRPFLQGTLDDYVVDSGELFGNSPPPFFLYDCK